MRNLERTKLLSLLTHKRQSCHHIETSQLNCRAVCNWQLIFYIYTFPCYDFEYNISIYTRILGLRLVHNRYKLALGYCPHLVHYPLLMGDIQFWRYHKMTKIWLLLSSFVCSCSVLVPSSYTNPSMWPHPSQRQ